MAAEGDVAAKGEEQKKKRRKKKVRWLSVPRLVRYYRILVRFKMR